MSHKEQSPPSSTTRICKNHNDSRNAYIHGATTHTRDQRADAETCLLFARCKKKKKHTHTQRLSFQSQTQALRNPVSCSPGASGFRKLEGQKLQVIFGNVNVDGAFLIPLIMLSTEWPSDLSPFRNLSYDRSIASSNASSPHSAS